MEHDSPRTRVDALARLVLGLLLRFCVFYFASKAPKRHGEMARGSFEHMVSECDCLHCVHRSVCTEPVQSQLVRCLTVPRGLKLYNLIEHFQREAGGSKGRKTTPLKCMESAHRHV